MYNRFLISRENLNLREPTNPTIIPFFGWRGHYKTAFDMTAVLLAPARQPSQKLTTILPCRDKTDFFIGIGGSFL